MWYGRFNTRIWKRAVAASGVGKSPNIHDLRHSYASWLLAAGAPLNVVQAKLGHEDIKVTVNTYGHLAPQADMDVVSVLDRAHVALPGPVLELGA
jgi:integrase